MTQATSHSTTARRPDLGILFVHGIGQPGPGETLVRFGDPICDWLRRWLGTPVQLDLASLQPPLDDPEAPAQVRARFQLPDQSEQHTWLLAEARWAGSFPMPRFRDLAIWGLWVTPWSSACHFGLRVRRLWKHQPALSAPWCWLNWLRLALLTVGYTLLSLVGSCLLLLLIVLLLLLALVPIASLRSTIVRIHTLLAGSLGDSYVLLASPIQAATIIGQVSRALRWMLHHCERVAVVAHSQGAAVSFEVLRTGVVRTHAKDRVMFATLGSGLAKLEDLRRCLANTGQSLIGWLPIVGMVLMVLGSRHANLPVTGSQIVDFIQQCLGGTQLSIALLGAAIWLSSAIWASDRAARFRQEDFDPSERFGIPLTWIDFYASADPVPNGPLFDKDQTPDYLQSHEVYNRASMWSDHTAYWENAEAVVAPLTTTLANFALTPIATKPGDEERIRAANPRRRFRIQCLQSARALIGLLFIVLLAGKWRDATAFGSATLQIVERIPGTSYLLTLAHSWLPLGPAGQAQLLGATLLLAVALGVYVCVYVIWRLWEWSDIDDLLRRGTYGLFPFWIFAGGAFLLVDAVLVQAFSTTSFVAPETNLRAFLPWFPALLAGALTLLRLRAGGRAWDSSVGYGLLRGLAIALLTIPAVMAFFDRLPTPWGWSLVACLGVFGAGLAWYYDRCLRVPLHRIASVDVPPALT